MVAVFNRRQRIFNPTGVDTIMRVIKTYTALTNQDGAQLLLPDRKEITMMDSDMSDTDVLIEIVAFKNWSSVSEMVVEKRVYPMIRLDRGLLVAEVYFTKLPINDGYIRQPIRSKVSLYLRAENV